MNETVHTGIVFAGEPAGQYIHSGRRIILIEYRPLADIPEVFPQRWDSRNKKYVNEETYIPRRIDWARYAGTDARIPLCMVEHEWNKGITVYSGIPTVLADVWKNDSALLYYQRRDSNWISSEGILNADAMYEGDAKLLFPECRYHIYNS